MSFEGAVDESTRAAYERATFGRQVTLGTRPAVLVVDFSCGFTDPASVLGCDMTPEVEACRRVLDAARAVGAFVVYTTVAYAPHRKDAGMSIQKSPAVADLAYGSQWAEIDPRLGVRPEEPVIVKTNPSAFFGTPLTTMFTMEKIDTVILCGATTSGCIRATSIDLFQHGYAALVPRDCVADRAPGPHEANLFDINEKYVDVVSSERAIEYLSQVPSTAGAAV